MGLRTFVLDMQNLRSITLSIKRQSRARFKFLQRAFRIYHPPTFMRHEDELGYVSIRLLIPNRSFYFNGWTSPIRSFRRVHFVRSRKPPRASSPIPYAGKPDLCSALSVTAPFPSDACYCWLHRPITSSLRPVVSLRALAFLGWFTTKDSTEASKRLVSDRGSTHSARMYRIAFVVHQPDYADKRQVPSIASIVGLRRHVPVVEIVQEKEGTTDRSVVKRVWRSEKYYPSALRYTLHIVLTPSYTTVFSDRFHE